MIAPRTVSGTLELLPREQMIFQYMVDVIRSAYERFGFVQIETPVFELKDVLLTKSGGETEKQVYFVQSTGAVNQGHEADLALHFDLTVPLARYVAQHERELAFPFRRYQIQRVYRGERAQRGRFREFYQCDIDIIGKDKLSFAYDAEIPAIIVQIFEKLNIGDFTIHFSNRKILRGLLIDAGIDDEEKQKLILREIDKLGKIGEEKVRTSIIDLGMEATKAERLLHLIASKGSKDEILHELKSLDVRDSLFNQGIDEIAHMIETLRSLNVPEKRTQLNLSIARGLDYYTGTVYETLIDEHAELGSVCSGGRYDDLASHYTKSKLPGVGISIGLTRLFDQLRSIGSLPSAPPTTQVLILSIGDGKLLQQSCLKLAMELRAREFTVDRYMESAKLDKQLKYADKAGIPVVIMIGDNELAKGTFLVKNMKAKVQKEVTGAALAETICSILED